MLLIYQAIMSSLFSPAILLTQITFPSLSLTIAFGNRTDIYIYISQVLDTNTDQVTNCNILWNWVKISEYLWIDITDTWILMDISRFRTAIGIKLISSIKGVSNNTFNIGLVSPFWRQK